MEAWAAGEAASFETPRLRGARAQCLGRGQLSGQGGEGAEEQLCGAGRK
jgi:hypothetical protein